VSREKIEAMFLVRDIRETRVYQEAKEEAIEEERARYLQERLRTVAKFAAYNITPEQIADILDLDLELVLKELATTSS